MTELIGESVLLEKEEYDQLKLKAELGECLLDHLLRNYSDDTWSQTTRDTMDECAVAFWGSEVVWNIDEEESEDD